MSKTPQNPVSRTSLRSQRNSLFSSLGLVLQWIWIGSPQAELKLLKDFVRRSDYVWPKTGGFELFFKNLPGNIFWQTNSIQKKGRKSDKENNTRFSSHTKSFRPEVQIFSMCWGLQGLHVYHTKWPIPQNVPDNPKTECCKGKCSLVNTFIFNYC